MALDQIVFSGLRQVNERSALTVTARFRDRAAVADVTPTNVYWRLDDENGCQLADWTSVTPASQVSIAVPAEQNRILNCTKPVEQRTLTVMADRGLATQFTVAYYYSVRNLPWRS
jgi:hypothetical protein